MNTNARRLPHTPLPEENTLNEANLTFKPSELPWVKLTTVFGPAVDGFAPGQIVQIYGVVPSYISPSAPRSESEWIPNDGNALYRFRKCCTLLQYNSVNLKPVPHRKLHMTPTSPGRPGTSRDRSYANGDVVYLAEVMQVQWGNRTFEVKKGTAVVINERSSKSGRPNDKLSTNVNLESMYYNVRVYIESPQAYTTRDCGHGRHLANFQLLSDTEYDRVQQNLSRVLDTTSHVVSVTDVPLENRGRNGSRLKGVDLLKEWP
ncbi:hypothetical protein BD309DRAFT_977507 [Dichomitus squalens]|uniref:Uncharacterized protein n=1 Tax=Dichomitus squalens TaxID=114155 RepID=A0A4Q9PYE7_9APHY|nr:hypothetical protein BD309DRAFT_977507 [Dichomitus squalens]TBU59665.1 hypothetical protein BD310DRAFT_1008287 [Dichomitus squalens]